MPFYIPKNCDLHLAHQIGFGEEVAAFREGWWSSLQLRVRAFFRFSWKLSDAKILEILKDSEKCDKAVKIMMANPRWLRKKPDLAVEVYDKLNLDDEKRQFKALIMSWPKVDSIAEKRFGIKLSIFVTSVIDFRQQAYHHKLRISR